MCHQELNECHQSRHLIWHQALSPGMVSCVILLFSKACLDTLLRKQTLSTQYESITSAAPPCPLQPSKKAWVERPTLVPREKQQASSENMINESLRLKNIDTFSLKIFNNKAAFIKNVSGSPR
ncbi:hypothetical protein CDAR_611661 [Caerostris darwini]|uniref:Uncharacterized protein n=1 Tax=Caerostris darwini TaxID=1538125 RepID=A0AAV4U2T1_9ARAC|nr:hypothetical protein CDAR_611661 [Caerostris darwini]